MQPIKLPLFCICIISQIPLIASFPNGGYAPNNYYNYRNTQGTGTNNGNAYSTVNSNNNEAAGAYSNQQHPQNSGKNGISLVPTTERSFNPNNDINPTTYPQDIQRSENPLEQGGNEHYHMSPTERSQQRHICTISTEGYDCQIQSVNLKHGEVRDFGLESQTNKKNITFQDSVLQYLPKSLIDAFPNMMLLNLNNLKIETIEDNAFNSAANLETLYLEGNRLITFPHKVLQGAPQLQILVLSNNDINSIPYAFKNNRDLSYLYVNNNKLSKLPTFDHLTKLIECNASWNNLEEVTNQQFSKQNQIERIDLSHNRLNNLNLQLQTNTLDIFDVSYNELIDVNIPLIMKRLFAQNNSLSKLTVTEECNLETLDIHNNKIEEQPNLSSCNMLQFLELSNNLMQYFEYTQSLRNLIYLNLEGNNLFDIMLPTKFKTPPALKTLILSHNKLSYLPSLSPFTSLLKVELNDNNLIAIRNYNMPPYLTHIFVANNEWKCDDVNKFPQKYVKDSKHTFCNQGFENKNGICCRQYALAFNDKLNEQIRESFFHEQINNDKLKKNCANNTKQERNSGLHLNLESIARVDKNKADVLTKIEAAKQSNELLTQNLHTEKHSETQISNFQQNMALEIEKKRKNYRVTKEGLIGDKEMLEKILKFVLERDIFYTDLLAGRKKETDDTAQILEQNKREKEELLVNIEQQTNSLAEMKKQEKDLKKQVEKLQKQVNRNAPAIHGKTGKS